MQSWNFSIFYRSSNLNTVKPFTHQVRGLIESLLFGKGNLSFQIFFQSKLATSQILLLEFMEVIRTVKSRMDIKTY